MKFGKRLAYYLFGFLFGCMFLFFFWNQKNTSFCYLPNCRVLKELRSKPIKYSDKAEKQLNILTLNNKDLKECLTNGSVDFSKSNIPEGNGKLYIVSGYTISDKQVIIEIVNYPDFVLLRNISANN